jgi:hypothetical protein
MFLRPLGKSNAHGYVDEEVPWVTSSTYIYKSDHAKILHFWGWL